MAEKNDVIRGGRVFVTVNGEVMDIVGDVTLNYGVDTNEEVIGADRVHGTKVKINAPKIELQIRDRGSLDIKKLIAAKNVTVACERPNGKTAVLREGNWIGSGNLTTDEGILEGGWVGTSMEDI